MFWTQAAGLTHLGRARSATATSSTTPASIARRRTPARRIARTLDGRVQGGFITAAWLIDAAARPIPVRLPT